MTATAVTVVTRVLVSGSLTKKSETPCSGPLQRIESLHGHLETTWDYDRPAQCTLESVPKEGPRSRIIVSQGNNVGMTSPLMSIQASSQGQEPSDTSTQPGGALGASPSRNARWRYSYLQAADLPRHVQQTGRPRLALRCCSRCHRPCKCAGEPVELQYVGVLSQQGGHGHQHPRGSAEGGPEGLPEKVSLLLALT